MLGPVADEPDWLTASVPLVRYLDRPFRGGLRSLRRGARPDLRALQFRPGVPAASGSRAAQAPDSQHGLVAVKRDTPFSAIDLPPRSGARVPPTTLSRSWSVRHAVQGIVESGGHRKTALGHWSCQPSEFTPTGTRKDCWPARGQACRSVQSEVRKHRRQGLCIQRSREPNVQVTRRGPCDPGANGRRQRTKPTLQ